MTSVVISALKTHTFINKYIIIYPEFICPLIKRIKLNPEAKGFPIIGSNNPRQKYLHRLKSCFTVSLICTAFIGIFLVMTLLRRVSLVLNSSRFKYFRFSFYKITDGEITKWQRLGNGLVRVISNTPLLNPSHARFHWNFHPLEVVSHRRDPQLQMSENYSDLTKF